MRIKRSRIKWNSGTHDRSDISGLFKEERAKEKIPARSRERTLVESGESSLVESGESSLVESQERTLAGPNIETSENSGGNCFADDSIDDVGNSMLQ